MRLSHKTKVKVARKHRTHQELLDRVPIFETKWWEKRLKLNRKKVVKKLAKAKALKELKKKQKAEQK